MKTAAISDGPWQDALFLVPVIGAVLTSALLILLLHPLLRRYALARPNARSSHKESTPQGGGIAVIASVILVASAFVFATPAVANASFGLLLAATVFLAIVGTIDDIRPLDPLLRLAIQSIAVLALLAVLPAGILPVLPWWIERALLFVAVLWFVNLVNFMDGIDWMTVAEVVPITAALALFGFMGALPRDAMVVALALCGAMLGFAPFNKPVARLFLGDVGSLPIGLLLAWLMIMLAQDHLAAAILLPLYYVADATITLLRRVVRGERIMEAHRSHFYQRALDGGFSVYQIVGRIFVVNVILAGLAALTIRQSQLAAQAACLTAGVVLVGALLWNFSRAPRSPRQ